MNEQVAANPLGTERVGNLMTRYAIPSIISIVVNSLYNMVDQIFIGQGVGYLGNAATNVIMPLTTILMALAFMLGDGTAAYMSLNLGKNRPDDAARGVGNLVTLTIGTGLIFLFLFQLFLKPLCGLFGATEGNLPYALDYGRIIVLGFPFSAVCSAFGSVIRADGRILFAPSPDGKAVLPPLQDVVGAPPHNDAGPLLRQLLNELGLIGVDLVRQGHIPPLIGVIGRVAPR